jgi:transcriptional regulator with XRE-family HTH domain
MTNFEAKQLNDCSLGDALRVKREALGLSLDLVERETRIAKKYLLALENDDLKRLPDLIYAKNFVRALAAHYGLGAEELIDELIRETAALDARPVSIEQPASYLSGRRVTMTPNLFKSLVAAAAFLVVIGYFALSVNKILKPPEITVYSPRDNEVYNSRHIFLSGQTEPEVELSVNREIFAINADGTFKDTFELPPGAHTLRIAAKKKHSKENEIFLRVVVEESNPVAIK